MNDKTQRFEDWFGDYLKKVKGPVSADAAYLLRDELPKAWHARDSELATLRSQLLQAQGEAAAKDEAIALILDYATSLHEPRCPEDDTCDCDVIQKINKAASGQAGKELLAELEALRQTVDRLELIEKYYNAIKSTMEKHCAEIPGEGIVKLSRIIADLRKAQGKTLEIEVLAQRSAEQFRALVSDENMEEVK